MNRQIDNKIERLLAMLKRCEAAAVEAEARWEAEYAPQREALRGDQWPQSVVSRKG